MDVTILNKKEGRPIVALLNKKTGNLFLRCFDYTFLDPRGEVYKHFIFKDSELSTKGKATLEEIYEKNKDLFTPFYEGDEISIKF